MGNEVLGIWAKRYYKGFNDKGLGKTSEIKQETKGSFTSVFDMDISQADDEGYIAGYEDRKEGKSFLNKTESEIQKKFEKGYSDGLQDRLLGKKSKVKEEEDSPKGFLSTDMKAKRSYGEGYRIGYKNGKP